MTHLNNKTLSLKKKILFLKALANTSEKWIFFHVTFIHLDFTVTHNEILMLLEKV